MLLVIFSVLRIEAQRNNNSLCLTDLKRCLELVKRARKGLFFFPLVALYKYTKLISYYSIFGIFSFSFLKLEHQKNYVSDPLCMLVQIVRNV